MRLPTIADLRMFAAALLFVMALPAVLHAEGKTLKGVALVIG